MLRKEQRRRARRAVIRTRVVAAGTAILLALGVAVGGGVAAVASGGGGGTTNTNSADYWEQLPGEVCVKPAFSSENATTTPFTLPALGAGFAYSKVIVKAGSSGNSVTEENSVYTADRAGGSLTAGDTFVHREKNSISHVIYCYVPSVPSAGNDLTCDVATNYPGRALTNGDHINMDIVQGGQKFQVNASVDIRQAQDPASESGLVLRVNAPGGPYTLPITNDQKNSGILSFSYASYLTGSFTVEWVQFNSTYFNQNRDATKFLVCGDLPTEELVTPTARMVDLGCDTAGSYTLDDIEGIRWFLGDVEVEPGTYNVSTASTVTVRAEAIGPDYGLEPDAQTEWTFTFTEPDDCALPCLPASAVSYTYYNLSTDSEANPANSGLITVAARDGYSTELCNDFWVVAAAWNYTSSTSIWPQTLRSTDPAGVHDQGYIGSVGTYFFHAPVACGQGDVYASFTGMPYVGPELFGPSNPFSETFLHNMGFTGPNPTYLNTAPGCNVVNPIAPTANPIVECGTTGSIDISDVGNPYIGYTVYRGAADENGSVDGLETVNLQDATEGVFTVVATPLGGTIFAPSTVRQWEFDLGEQYDCPIDVDLRLTYMQECAPDSTYTFRVRNLESVSVPYTFTVYGNPALNGSGVATPGDSFFTLDVPRTAESPSYTVILHWGDGTTIVEESTTKASGPDLDCEPPTLPITDASIAFIAPTCDLGQQLDPTKFVVDAELARFAPELSSLTGPDYTVVFVTTDPDAVFFDSDTPPAGRVVSDDGTTLTFTGTLLGPDRSEDCVTTVELRDPVSFVDSCLEGASFTITRVEGILYTVFINDDEPFEVVWNDGEATRTYPVAEGDSVRVVPSPASDRYTISPDPAPFERTFAVYEDDCLPTLPLTAGSATFTPASCVDPTNWVVLENVEGVQWWVDGEPVAAGRWPMPVGDVVVTATPEQGYGFPVEAQTRWEFTAVAVDPECLPTLAFTGATSALAGLGGFSLLLLLVGFGAMALRRQQA